MKVTLSGSLQRHHQELLQFREAFVDIGSEVLSPSAGAAIDNIGGFVLLEGDSGSPGHIEQQHLAAIAMSDLLYVVMPDGYVGTKPKPKWNLH